LSEITGKENKKSQHDVGFFSGEISFSFAWSEARISGTLSTYLRRNNFVSPLLEAYAQNASTGRIQ
jgi:hypothetical protein